mmetsp:Transcript_23844/g.40583  ORF Transcript_23844/g.40583 Transcript_23844/m.40583 type:complete len:259 (+) Transcript_23844:431-1207(+)
MQVRILRTGIDNRKRHCVIRIIIHPRSQHIIHTRDHTRTLKFLRCSLWHVQFSGDNIVILVTRISIILFTVTRVLSLGAPQLSTGNWAGSTNFVAREIKLGNDPHIFLITPSSSLLNISSRFIRNEIQNYCFLELNISSKFTNCVQHVTTLSLKLFLQILSLTHGSLVLPPQLLEFLRLHLDLLLQTAEMLFKLQIHFFFFSQVTSKFCLLHCSFSKLLFSFSQLNLLFGCFGNHFTSFNQFFLHLLQFASKVLLLLL